MPDAPLLECVPNVSEGRSREALDALAAAMRAVPGAHLLDHGPVADLLAAVGESGVTRRDDLQLDLE